MTAADLTISVSSQEGTQTREKERRAVKSTRARTREWSPLMTYRLQRVLSIPSLRARALSRLN